MIKIDRNPAPPPSLAVEEQKAKGVYNKPDVIQRLKEDPEKMLEQCYEEGHVNVHNIVDEERAFMTADLIQECFEKCNTGTREAACQHRIDPLADEMNILYKTLEKYKKNPELLRYKRSLRSTLSRNSIFAAFKRNYVRKHISDYPGLEEFLM